MASRLLVSSRSLVNTIAKNSVVVGTRAGRPVPLTTSNKFHTSAMVNGGGGGGGGGHSPPLPPFARNQPQFKSMSESCDVVWNDGVAPELAVDFEMQNVASSTALATLVGVFTGFFILFQTIAYVTTDMENPALEHITDIVIPTYTDPNTTWKKTDSPQWNKKIS